MPRFSGRLQEVVAYESQTTASLFQERVWRTYLYEESFWLHMFS